jgi:DUF4097 and DUF4098 domain-containing protein YvlB
MRRGVLAVLLLTAASVASAQSNDFRWSGTIERGKTIEIKGINGTVRAELASGNQVEVTASKRARRSNPDDVRVEVVQENGNVTICAVYPNVSDWRWFRGRDRDRDDRPNECRPGSAGHMNVRDNDVAVDFIVRVPAGVRFAGKTVNGNVAAEGLRSDVVVRTVNGKIAMSTSGSGTAHTVNGSIDASIGNASGNEPLTFKTTNGSITLRVPKNVNANLHASTVNGRFQSDVPLMVKSMSGRRQRHVDGTLGSGGRELEVTTVNGSIDLRLVPGN